MLHDFTDTGAGTARLSECKTSEAMLRRGGIMGQAMRSPLHPTNGSRTGNRVLAVYDREALSFDLPRDATLADLAEILGSLSASKGGLPHQVEVAIR
jgi:hypothetical protein